MTDGSPVAIVNQTEVENIYRYVQAMNFCRDKVVLDVASGEGYGAALLAQHGRMVVGVAFEPGQAERALLTYPAKNLTYLAGREDRIPLDDSSIDVVTSFQTIDYLKDRDVFIKELRRVLRPGGMLIVSTLGEHRYTQRDQAGVANASSSSLKDAFAELLSGSFSHTALFAQRIVPGSVLMQDVMAGDDRARTVLAFGKDDNPHWDRPNTTQPLSYLLAYASDEPIPDAVSHGQVSLNASQIEQAAEFITVFRALASHEAELAKWKASEHSRANRVELLQREVEAATQKAEGAIASSAVLQSENSRLAHDLSLARQAIEARAAAAATLGINNAALLKDMESVRAELAQQNQAAIELQAHDASLRHVNVIITGQLASVQLALRHAESELARQKTLASP